MATILGTTGNDIIDEVANGGSTVTNDEIFADAGNDIIRMYHNYRTNDTGGYVPVTDIVHGGSGTDTFRMVIQNAIFGFTGSGDLASGYAGTISFGAAHSIQYDGIEQFDLDVYVVHNITLFDGNDRVRQWNDGAVTTGGGDDLVISSLRTSNTANLGDGNDTLVLDWAGMPAAVYLNGPLTGSLAAGYSGQYYVAGAYAQMSFSGVENFQITTSNSADTVIVGDGNDIISTNGGSDFVQIGRGIDSAAGGDGIDAVSIDLSDETTGVTIDLLLGGAQASGGLDVMSGFESFAGAVTGSAFNDVLREGLYDYDATFNTGEGDDTVEVRDGSDTVNMGGGSGDRLVIDHSAQVSRTYLNSTFDGTLATGYSGQYYIAGAYAQTTFTGVEHFTITTNAGADYVVTGDGNDIVFTDESDDGVVVGKGNDDVDGGSGTDWLAIDLSDETGPTVINLLLIDQEQMTAGLGSVTNFESFGATVTGSAYADELREGLYSFDATFNTGEGNDTVEVRDGEDVVNMGGGTGDRLVINHSAQPANTYINGAFDGTLATGYAGEYYISGGYARTTFTGVEHFTIITNAGADTIRTGDGDDIVFTDEGGDVITVGKGNDTVDGGSGVDWLSIDLSDETGPTSIDLTLAGQQQLAGIGSVMNVESFGGTVTGSAQADTLREADHHFDATFNMGGGDDTVEIRDGEDVINGEAGNDRLIVNWSEQPAFTYFNASALTATQGGGYTGEYYVSGGYARATFSGIENFTITTNAGSDTVVTGAGNDVIFTDEGNDGMTVGTGNDTVDGGTGVDALSIDLSDETGPVTINLLATGAQQTGGSGSVTNVESFFGTVTGSSYADTLREDAHDFNTTFNTGLGADTVEVRDGEDIVNMGAGSDRLVIDHSAQVSRTYINSAFTGDMTTGYSGEYYIAGAYARTTFTGVEHFTITTNAGNDDIITGNGNDVIVTDEGSDTIAVGMGNDSVDGGAGVDALSISLADDTGPVTIDLTATGQQQTGGTGSVTNVETFTGLVTGSAFADVLRESAVDANATFNTGAGDDLVEVRDGEDVINLGAGSDRMVLDWSGQPSGAVYLSIAFTGNSNAGYAGQYYVGGGYARATFTGVEHFTIRSSGGSDTLLTGAGRDIVHAGAGNDNVSTQGGDDIVGGDLGNDTLNGGSGIDTVDYSGVAAAVTVSLSTSGLQATGGAGNDRLSGFENLIGSAFNDVLKGNGGANSLTGGDGNDSINAANGNDILTGGLGNDQLLGGNDVDNLQGGEGNDVLNGQSGADTMAGGLGDDTYYVDVAGDVVSEAADAGLDTIRSSINYTLGDNIERLFLDGTARTGTGNALANTIFGTSSSDTLSGLAGDDLLRGYNGADTLLGGDGNDLLYGGALRDTLTGGSGRDQFRFEEGDSSNLLAQSDRITDFSRAEGDRIYLSPVDADANAAGDQAFSFLGSAAFTGVAGQLRSYVSGADTIVAADTNGDTAVDFYIRLTGNITLAASDFVL